MLDMWASLLPPQVYDSHWGATVVGEEAGPGLRLPTRRGHLAIACEATLLLAPAAYHVCQRRKIHCLFFFSVALRRYCLVVRLCGLQAAVKEAAVHSIWIPLGLDERHDFLSDLLVVQEAVQML